MLGIRRKRIESRKTIAEIAAEMDVADNTVWRWETGNRTPSVVMLKKLAELFKCSIDELLDTDRQITGNPPRPSPEEGSPEGAAG